MMYILKRALRTVTKSSSCLLSNDALMPIPILHNFYSLRNERCKFLDFCKELRVNNFYEMGEFMHAFKFEDNYQMTMLTCKEVCR